MCVCGVWCGVFRLNILSNLHFIVNWFSFFWFFFCFLVRIPRVSQPLHTFRRLIRCQTRIRHLGWSFCSFSRVFFVSFFIFVGPEFLRFWPGPPIFGQYPPSSPSSPRSTEHTRTRSRSVGWLRVAYRFLHLHLRLRLRLFLTRNRTQNITGGIFFFFWGYPFPFLVFGWPISPRFFGLETKLVRWSSRK